jgi:hypothetical protein
MSRAWDSTVGRVLHDPYGAEPFRRIRNVAPEFGGSVFGALVLIAMPVTMVIESRRTTIRVLDSGQPHNVKVHRARAHDEPLQTRRLTGSVCNAWFVGGLVIHLSRDPRACDRHQQAQHGKQRQVGNAEKQ